MCPARPASAIPRPLRGDRAGEGRRRLRAVLRAGCVLAFAALAGCAAVPPERDATPRPLAERCERALAALDDAVAQAGVGDAEASRVTGFPYLRSNRFLASFRDAPLDDAQYREWVDAMMRLDREGRIVEIANLPADATRAALAALRAEGFADLAPAALLEGCAMTLRERDLADENARDRLRAAAAVPDDYDTWKRIVGLYAVTRIPFAAGVRRWQDETLAVFAVPLAAQPVAGTLMRYALAEGSPSARADAARVLAEARADSRLGIHGARALQALAAVYAPVFEVDEVSAADRVGRPALDASAMPGIETTKPAIFVRVAHTRYQGEVLPQLVYTIWFPGRPKSGAFDLLGGKLDAVIWRVTLANDGEPLVFDTIHGCGCYHLFFPTPRATPRPAPDGIEEWAFVPATLPRVARDERIVVRIAPGTHYVSAVAVARGHPPGTKLLGASDEDSLRRLPLAPDATRSLYGPDGIVPGTQRGERYVFWPMGVPDPGAMRQWGRHATAFVGRRHFDDAHLVERYFMLDDRRP